MIRSLKWIMMGAVVIAAIGVLSEQSAAQLSPPADEPTPTPDTRLQPGRGWELFGNDKGQLRFSVYTYLRYLNQDGLEDTYENSNGVVRDIDKRDDLQFQKLVLYFKGWIADPKFRYLTYVWTSNTSQGQGAQVVVAGNLSYAFNAHLTLGAGIGALPGTRSLRGSWPYWLKQDSRTIADEYFRGSYTTGIWANGDINEHLHYFGMIGDNLSQLGVDAVQMDNGMNTYSGSLWWTGGGFGTHEGLGDFEHHDQVATTLGTSFTASRESRQSQPGEEDPENTQIRLSDGTGIFQIDAFGPGLAVSEADYRMLEIDGEVKHRGCSLGGGYYWRWVENLDSNAPLPVDHLFDHGYEVQAAVMAVPRTLMVYAFTSKIFGEYGEPWDAGGGLNYYPLKTRLLRFNPEIIFTDKSPVGYSSYPLVVGADGPVFMMNIELYF